MGYVSNPSGIGVGKRYGSRQVGTTDGVLTTKGGKLFATFKLSYADVTGPHKISIPPFCKVVKITQACKSAWDASKAYSITLDGNKITDGTTDPTLGTALGLTDATLNSTAANLETKGTAKMMVITPPTGSTKGYSDIMVELQRI